MKIKLTFVFSYILISSCFMTAYSQPFPEMGKPDKQQKELAQTLGKPADGMARIIFKRQGSIVGAIVPHLIVDRGENIIYNAMVVQDERFADFDGNFDKARNVTQVYILDAKSQPHLIQGVPLPGDKSVIDESEIFTTIISFNDNVTGSKEHKVKSKGFWISTQNLSPNARLAGVVKSGDVAGWDRKPGKIRIEVIVPNGDQGFCPAFIAEAGKTYFVDYYYMKADFRISVLE
jgi:hypothetical protein